MRYEPDTGNFIWLVLRNSHGGKVKPGAVAGTRVVEKNGDKRIIIGVFGKYYRAHRLAFLFMTGKLLPRHIDVDHEDGDDFNNRWSNLRPATRGQNNWNNHNIRCDNKSGVRGVSWSIQAGKWTARVTVNKKVIHLGNFAKLKDAAKVRRAAELKYFGQYAPK